MTPTLYPYPLGVPLSSWRAAPTLQHTRLERGTQVLLRRADLERALSRNASEFPAISVRAPHDVRTITTAYGSVEMYSRDPGSVVALTGRYFLQISRFGQASMTIVSQSNRAVADLAARNEKFGWVSIIEPEADLSMPTDVRNGFNALVKRYSTRISGAAIVFEKTGFHATAVRSLVTAINVASRATHPNRVFSDVREAVSWVSKLAGGEPSVAGLAHIIQHLRSQPT